MTAALTSGCMCGRAATAACATLHGLPQAQAEIEARGWEWYASGHFCSDVCAWEAESYLALRQMRACVWPRQFLVEPSE